MAIPKTMKAAILVEQRKPLIIAEIELPQALDVGQVLVKVHYSGICGSQLGEIDGAKGEVMLGEVPTPVPDAYVSTSSGTAATPYFIVVDSQFTQTSAFQLTLRSITPRQLGPLSHQAWAVMSARATPRPRASAGKSSFTSRPMPGRPAP